MPILPLIVDQGATMGVLMSAAKDPDMPHFLDGFEGGVTDATARIELYLATYTHCTFPHAVYGVTDLTIDESNRKLSGGATFRAISGTAHGWCVKITGDNNTIDGLTVDPLGDDVTVTGDRAGWFIDGDNNKLVNCYAVNGDSNSASRGFRNVGDQNVFERCSTTGGWWIGFSNNGTTSGAPRPRATYKDIFSTGAVSRPFDHDFNSEKLVIDGAHLETDSTDASLIVLGLSSGVGRTLGHCHLTDVWCKATSYSHPDGQPIVKLGEATEYVIEDCDFIRTNMKGAEKTCLVTDAPLERLVIRDSHFLGRLAPAAIAEYVELTRCRVGGPVATGTAQAGAATTITLSVDETFPDDELNDYTIVIVDGTGVGQHNQITDYVESTKVATVSTWTTNPDATSVYEIYASHKYAIAGMRAPTVRLENNTFRGFDTAAIGWKTPDVGELICLYAKNNTCIGDSTTQSPGTTIIMFAEQSPGTFITPAKYNVTYTELTDLNPSGSTPRPCLDGDGRICMGDGLVPGYKDWNADPTEAAAGADLEFTVGDLWIHNNGINTEATGWMITTAGKGPLANPTELGTITEL